MTRTEDRRFPSRRAALLSAMAVATAAMLPLIEAQECPWVPEQIVSSSCELCTRGQLCQTKANKCNCFTVGAPALNFLLPFSAVTTASLNATTLPASDYVAGPDDTTTTPWASDDDIEKFEQLVLPASTTTVNIRGGNSLTAIYKGVVADVLFVGNFLGGQSQLKRVFLANLNLANTASNLIGNFPVGVEAVALANNRLIAFPTSITKFKSLKRLFLSFNDITEVPSSSGIESLVEIDLRSNKVASFSAVYANSVLVYLQGNQIKSFKQENAVLSVETLDLADNALKMVPAVIFKHTKLTSLFLQMNSQLVDVAFTSEQANFLNTLREFQITPASLRSGCSAAQQFELKKFGYTVCITGAVDAGVLAGARVAPSTPTPPGLSSDAVGASDAEIPEVPGVSMTLTTPGSTKKTGQTSGSSGDVASKASGSNADDSINNGSAQEAATTNIVPIIVGVSLSFGVVIVIAVLYLRKNRSRGKHLDADPHTTPSTLTGLVSAGELRPTLSRSCPPEIAEADECDDQFHYSRTVSLGG
ncbi:hypothetical protein PybrP1_013009 [[Pythium] brassicae (nom. inval.)]|nr:hypothetical protein PybrP1_013009 [[Pythium] brassicae (nom. inval.)]